MKKHYISFIIAIIGLGARGLDARTRYTLGPTEDQASAFAEEAITELSEARTLEMEKSPKAHQEALALGTEGKEAGKEALKEFKKEKKKKLPWWWCAICRGVQGAKYCMIKHGCKYE